MYKNIGKKIHLLAIILAALCAVGFLAAAVVFLLAAWKAEGGSSARAAGFEGAGVFLVLAVLSPLCSWVLYGFGSLVDAAERQAEAQKDVRDIVKKALSDGALSDEVARKLGNSLSKLTVAAAPAPRSGVAPTRPVVRGSVKPMEPAKPVTPAPVQTAEAAPVVVPMAEATPTPGKEETPAAPVAEKAPERPAIHFTAPSDAPAKPALMTEEGTVSPIKPLNADTTY